MELPTTTFSATTRTIPMKPARVLLADPPWPEKGQIVRKRFDGRRGVPKHCLYLGIDGTWKDSIRKAMPFRSNAEAKAFLDLRLTAEEREFELQALAHLMARSGTKVPSVSDVFCPTFTAAFLKSKEMG